jgi:integrase
MLRTLTTTRAAIWLTVQHPNTQKRYRSSVHSLVASFGNVKLSDITGDVIEDFKEKRLAQGVRTATLNRDLAVLHRMMKLAERKMLITESPFRDVDFLEERKQRRRPHILTSEEEDRVLAAAVPHIRALAALILETGMRSRREALSLLWSDVDLVNDIIRMRESKTRAGERTIPISDRCKTELLRWRSLLGPEFSSYTRRIVFRCRCCYFASVCCSGPQSAQRGSTNRRRTPET